MKSVKSSTSIQQQHRQDISSDSSMLTPLEIEQLRQDAREADAYYQKAFAHLRPPKAA